MNHPFINESTLVAHRNHFCCILGYFFFIEAILIYEANFILTKNSKEEYLKTNFFLSRMRLHKTFLAFLAFLALHKTV